MPEVFRRLTQPVSTASFDEVARSRVLAASGQMPSPLTVGGVPSSELGPQASAYLEALLEAHE